MRWLTPKYIVHPEMTHKYVEDIFRSKHRTARVLRAKSRKRA